MSGPLSRLVNYPGWIGQHTREEAEGALENGTRVRKIGSRPREGHQDGALATVLGSVIAPWGPGYGYFVEWDDRPREAVFIASRLTTTSGIVPALPRQGVRCRRAELLLSVSSPA
jgi:hypothetical protein